MSNFYDFSLERANGELFHLKDLKGKVVLVVNTATGCGFTPQYTEIESLYRKYHDKGFEVIDIPCNQFGNQAPGSDDEIHEFCTLHYNTTFEQYKKSDVNGQNELPLFKFLKSQKGFNGFGEGQMADILRSILPKFDPDYENNPNIKWNFTKFLVNKNGEVLYRFEPTEDLKIIEQKILELL